MRQFSRTARGGSRSVSRGGAYDDRLVLGDRPAAGKDRRPEMLELLHARVEPRERARQLAVRGRLDEDGVEARRPPRTRRRRPAPPGPRRTPPAPRRARRTCAASRCGTASSVASACRFASTGNIVTRVLRGDRRHARVALRSRLDHALQLEPREGVAHRRATESEPGAELGVVELLARRQRSLDDRSAQRVVGAVAQQMPLRGVTVIRDWHLTCQ